MLGTSKQPRTSGQSRTSGSPGTTEQPLTREDLPPVGVPTAGAACAPTEEKRILVEVLEVLPLISHLKSLPQSRAVLSTTAHAQSLSQLTACEMGTRRKRMWPILVSGREVTRSKPAAKVQIRSATSAFKYLPCQPPTSPLRLTCTCQMKSIKHRTGE